MILYQKKDYMQRKILLRFDDICPTMDFARFEQALEQMDSVNAKPLIGVIPDCKDPDLLIDPYRDNFWDYIRELQNKGYKVAMHGYQHIFDITARGLVCNGWKSEFAGHSYEEQFEKIKRGKDILERNGIYTDVFFAPAHSYDKNTIKALGDNGFRYMSDGKSSKPYMLYGIKCIPCRSSGVPILGKKTHYTAVFHAHEWVRDDKKDAYEKLKDIVNNHSREIVDFEEYAKQPLGIYFVQRVDEIIFVTWCRFIRPLLSRIYRCVKHKIKFVKIQKI